MHRGHFGGNARKQKAKLTDATFHAMIGTPQVDDSSLATLEAAADLELLVTREVVTEFTVASNAGVVATARRRDVTAFDCRDFEFGYVACRNCHNDQAYYAHRGDLDSGFSFRCRVCRLELTITTKPVDAASD